MDIDLSITPFYAAVLTMVFLVLSARVILHRLSKIGPSGEDGKIALSRSMRVQANFVEYVPLALILMLCVELQGAPSFAVHVMGLTLLVGRVLHAIGMSRTPQVFVMRQIGIMLTLTMLGLSAIAIAGHALV